MQPGLIINADDLGVDTATTAGIASAYQHGIVSSATLMVTTPAADQAVKTVRKAGIPVGMHLALTQGRAVAEEHLDQLVDETGTFKLRAFDLMRITRKSLDLVNQIRTEIRAQLARAADFGLLLTHVDSHQHVHMNPILFKVWEQEAAIFGITRIRFSCEPFQFLRGSGVYSQILKRNNITKWLAVRAYARLIEPQLEAPELFFGLLHSGAVVRDILLNVLAIIPAHKSVEICVHPGLPDLASAAGGDEPFKSFSTSTFRRLEHDALVDPEVLELVRKRQLTLRSFGGEAKSW